MNDWKKIYTVSLGMMVTVLAVKILKMRIPEIFTVIVLKKNQFNFTMHLFCSIFSDLLD